MGAELSLEAQPGAGPAILLIDEILDACLCQSTIEAIKPLFFLSPDITAILTTKYKVLCQVLSSESRLRMPPICHEGTWKAQFERLWELRLLWNPAVERDRRTFKISVAARLCPLRSVGGGAEGAEPDEAAGPRVTVPLHQRLQIVKKARQCSNSEALRLVFGGATASDDGGALDKDPWNRAEFVFVSPDSDAPLPHTGDDKENETGATDVVSAGEKTADGDADGDGDAGEPGLTAGVLTVTPTSILMCSVRRGVREYVCDRAFAHNTPQTKVYDGAARPIVSDFLNGVSGTVFMYGQTGSGKTYTMHGPDVESATTLRRDEGYDPRRGIVPRAMAEVMEWVTASSSRRHTATCKLQMTYVEIFGKEVSNLLAEPEAESRTVGAWAGVAAKTVLEGRCAVQINDEKSVAALLRLAESRKRTSATEMNERSTRAHSLLLLDLEQTCKDSEMVVRSTLCFADLGGSEQIKKSGVTGAGKDEAVQINLGLLALKKCIRALNIDAGHVPYSTSVLTSILARSLGGDARTAVIVTGSMHPQHTEETVQTLAFGEKCMNVENVATLSRICASGTTTIERINTELEKLLVQIKEKERWEEKRIIQHDVEGDEVKTQFYLVGAEMLRERYEQLLVTKQQLVGV